MWIMFEEQLMRKSRLMSEYFLFLCVGFDLRRILWKCGIVCLMFALGRTALSFTSSIKKNVFCHSEEHFLVGWSCWILVSVSVRWGVFNGVCFSFSFCWSKEQNVCSSDLKNTTMFLCAWRRSWEVQLEYFILINALLTDPIMPCGDFQCSCCLNVKDKLGLSWNTFNVCAPDALPNTGFSMCRCLCISWIQKKYSLAAMIRFYNRSFETWSFWGFIIASICF